MRFVLPTWLLATLIVVAEVMLVLLGVWQWQRNHEKQQLVAAFEERAARPPLAAAEVDATPPDERDFEVAGIEGRWDTEHIFRVSNRYRSAIQGEEAIVPLILPDGRGVLVNRGWYPLEERDRVLGELRSQTQGRVEGQVRRRPDLSGGPLSNRTWSRFDAPSMAATLPYPTSGWALIEGKRIETDSIPPGVTLPLTGWYPFVNTIPHLEYALTWWGLAAVFPVFSLVRFGMQRRGVAADEAARSDASASL